jgi:hypothetical protein
MASDSMEKNSPNHREISAGMISVRKEDFGMIKNEIRIFKKKLIKKLVEQPGPSNQIYCLNIQYFPIDRIENE